MKLKNLFGLLPVLVMVAGCPSRSVDVDMGLPVGAPARVLEELNHTLLIDMEGDAEALTLQSYSTQTSAIFSAADSGDTDFLTLQEWGSGVITSSTTRHMLELADTTNVITNGTVILSALNIDMAIGNSTAGTNTIYGVLIDGISADAQNTETAISVGAGWDLDLDLAGASSVGSLDVGGGYGDTGCSVTAAGVLWCNGNIMSDDALIGDSGTITNALSVGGGYGSTGCTTSTAGLFRCNDAITTDGALYAASGVITAGITIGGGYGATGASISTAGVGQFNDALTTDAAITADNAVITNAATFGGGYGSTGCTVTTAGVWWCAGGMMSDSSMIADSGTITNALTVGGGYGDTGCTTTTAGVHWCNGNIETDAAVYAGSAVITAGITVGGGYGATGCTVTTAGRLWCNDAIETDSTMTANAAVITTTLDVLAGTLAVAGVPGAGASGDLLDITKTFNAPDGTDVLTGLDMNLTGGAATGTGNKLYGADLGLTTPDAQQTEVALIVNDADWDYAIDTGDVPAILTAQTWSHDFLGDTAPAEIVEVSGTDGQALQAIVVEQFGVYQVTSGDDGANCAADCEGFNSGLVYQADQGSLIFQARAHIDDITNAIVCLGLTDNAGVEMPAQVGVGTDTPAYSADDFAAFCYDSGSTTDNWFVMGQAAGTPGTGTGVVAGVGPANGVYQVFRIEMDAAGGDVRYYIDGAEVGTCTATCITITDLLTPVVMADTNAAASVIVDVDYVYASAQRN